MRSIILFFSFLYCTSFASSQGISNMTAEERAYLFHIVRKSPILENSIGRYFEYTGPEIKLPNQKINYDSIENIIINQPELLYIRTSEIAKSPKGLLAEAANKMAIWELNKTLLAKRIGEKELTFYKQKYDQFEQALMYHLPPNALREENGEKVPHPKLVNVLNPGLSLNDKKAMLATFHFLDLTDQFNTLDAINNAINEYVAARSREFFYELGGISSTYTNILVAAGDGSLTAGILEEREKDENGRWNKGLPKAIGLFPYQLKIDPASEKKKAAIESLRFTSNDFKTSGNHLQTNIHLDVWGYNADKQTTVVIEKNGVSYHLFGSGETRFLSPDSSFSKGMTFQSVINDLKNNKIAKLDELLYGKRGYDYQIEYNEKRKEELLLRIEKNDKELSDLRQGTITTGKNSKKLYSNKVVDKTSNASTRKERKKKQDVMVYQYNQLESLKRKIAQLKKEKEEAIDLRSKYQLRLDQYTMVFGRNWMPYTEKDGLYTYKDSTTFDLYTQEFTFPQKEQAEDFEIRLIAIPYGTLSEQADEVMLHINITDALPNYDARVQLYLNDVFESDKWELETPILKEQDSVAVRQFFETLLDKKLPFTIKARGQGVGKWNGVQTVKDPLQEELSNYPGDRNTSKMDSTFLRLRKSEILIHLNRGITLEVNSYTDPVKSNLTINNPEISAHMQRYGLNKNQVLSGIRSASILKRLGEELNILAGEYLDRPSAKIVIDRLNSEIANTKVYIGPAAFKIDQLLK